ncbi:hypothetical protein ccbrp13_19100 [Ktedonobacteria bacterium brp13]|nr:hypothetical protein ccbrp13_19100 [Ktedonobacteria bacterium brp13]
MRYYPKNNQKLVPLFEGGDSFSYRGEPSSLYALDDSSTPTISRSNVDFVIKNGRLGRQD